MTITPYYIIKYKNYTISTFFFFFENVIIYVYFFFYLFIVIFLSHSLLVFLTLYSLLEVLQQNCAMFFLFHAYPPLFLYNVFSWYITNIGLIFLSAKLKLLFAIAMKRYFAASKWRKKEFNTKNNSK
jgi:hypothetical protein